MSLRYSLERKGLFVFDTRVLFVWLTQLPAAASASTFLINSLFIDAGTASKR